MNTKEYGVDTKQSLESLSISKQIEELPRRLKAIIKLNDKGAELIKSSLAFLFAYSAERIPEISDTIYGIDFAMRNGFAWELGPFEYWDAIGFENGKKLISAQGINLPDWIQEIKDGDQFSFYKTENKSKSYYDITLKSHVIIPGQQDIIDFSLYDKTSLVYSNDELQLHDIGDGVLCVEFKSKYNAIGEGILRGLNESVKIAEEHGWKGIVIGNNANNFTVGANLM